MGESFSLLPELVRILLMLAEKLRVLLAAHLAFVARLNSHLLERMECISRFLNLVVDLGHTVSNLLSLVVIFLLCQISLSNLITVIDNLIDKAHRLAYTYPLHQQVEINRHFADG